MINTMVLIDNSPLLVTYLKKRRVGDIKISEKSASKLPMIFLGRWDRERLSSRPPFRSTF